MSEEASAVEESVFSGVESVKLEEGGSKVEKEGEGKKILSPVAKARAVAKAKRGSVIMGSDMTSTEEKVVATSEGVNI